MKKVDRFNQTKGFRISDETFQKLTELKGRGVSWESFFKKIAEIIEYERKRPQLSE